MRLFQRYGLVRGLIVANVAVLGLIAIQALAFPEISYIGLDRDIAAILKRNADRPSDETSLYDLIVLAGFALILVATLPALVGLWFGKAWALWAYTVLTALAIGIISLPNGTDVGVMGSIDLALTTLSSMLSGAIIVAGFLTLKPNTTPSI